MPDTERSPLLSHENEEVPPNESAPLLSDRQDRDGENDQQADTPPRPPKSPARRKGKWRWPSIIAILVLAVLVVTIIVLGFVIPPAVQKYVEDAVVLEPTGLSLESLTADGVRARVQGNFRLDGSRVTDEHARRIGRLATGIMRQLGSKETTVNVRLPLYDNALLGTAVVPPLTLDLVDGHNNELDFVADILPGDANTMRKIVNDWLAGELDQLEVTGAAALSIKSGIFPLGTHDVVESMVFEANEIPSIPEYKIQNIAFHDVPVGDKGQMGVGANVSITLHNDYPIGLDVPSLGFEVLVPNCDPSEPNIKVATAVTSVIQIRPKSDVTAEAESVVRELPEMLTRACPDTELSPLDNFMKHYLHGENAQVFVRGKAPEHSNVPEWIGAILQSVTVPIDFPGRSFDNFIRNFSLTDVDFKLPSPFADPNDPNGKPRVSGTVQVLAGLPAELNIDLSVDSLKANGDLIYKKQKFGELNLERWQQANSSIASGSGDEEDTITITSRIIDAPIDITDGDIFGDVMQKLLFGDADVSLDVKALVDAKVATVLGKLVLKGVPAKGKVPVKHVPGDTLGALNPQVGDIRILNTSDTGVHLQTVVNLTNPTPYTATIPYMSIHVMKQGYMIGEAVARDIDFQIGNNSDIDISATWDPLTFSGEKGQAVGRRLLSEYLSGKNTTIELRAHRGSIPTMPIIGEALSKINMTLNTPMVKLPGDDDGEEGGHGFIRDATFHILSSTAAFTLASPLRHNTVHIEYINATAFYNHTEPVGQILHDEPFDAPPGLSQTPRLPVEWSASHVGFDKLKEALGGSLKLDALADVTVRLGNWVETVKYEGQGIGAKVAL
ncbi:Uncharacterized protein TPAR_05681 [Tolypocladium paradoxum]|uniref:Pre-rRNA processing protein n=1 Tax=Tolypocladium paradoxum TaxID=94208 RepID=A0A2S4KVC8_9HYPO|nr:Uncharacterized protein TPAR_05681 [Tolypocladium paradoxum]